MATNIIDAFLVTFGLDPSGYKKGAREISDGNKRLREDTKSTFDKMEDRGKKAGDTFRTMRNEVAGLLLVFAGGKSLTDFASNLLTGAANADRLGQTLGMSASRVTAWQEAIKSVGGSAGDADAALQSMQSTIMQWRLNPTQVNPGLLAFGINPSDMEKGPEQLLMKLAAGRDKFSGPQYASRLQMLGLPQSVIYTLEKGQRSVSSLVDAKEKDAAVTEKDAKAAEAFQAALSKLQTVIAGKVRPVLTETIQTVLTLIDNFGIGKVAIGAVGIVALGALGPLGLLAAAIALIALKISTLADAPDAFRIVGLKALAAYHHMRAWAAEKAGNKPEAILQKQAEVAALSQISDIYDRHAQAGGGADPYAGLSGDARTTAIRRSFPGYQPPRGGGNAGGSQHIVDYLMRSGFSPEQAAGIAVGIRAEGGGVGASANGAFGIGQWRGPRAVRLHRMFGASPTMDQQLAFLVWELHGGDHAGPSISRGKGVGDTATRYLRDFMRPGNGLAGDLGRAGNLINGMHRSRSSHVTIHGGVHVHTKATDAAGIAKDMHGAIRQRSSVLQADSGLAP